MEIGRITVKTREKKINVTSKEGGCGGRKTAGARRNERVARRRRGAAEREWEPAWRRRRSAARER